MFGFERPGFQLHHHIATQFQVIEQQVNEKVIAGHLDMHLPTDKGKTGPQFQQKTGDVLDDGGLNLALVGLLAYSEEIEKVRVYNVGPVQDMTRRCITIHLDPGCEVPAARSFTRPDLVRDVLRQRGRYVSAALTIVRAWIGAGRPKTECKSLAGFGDWSDLCRQPLLWLGLADPTDSVFKAMAEDPDRETLDRILTAWQSIFGKTAAMVRDAVKQALSFTDEHVELREMLRDIADERGEINRRKLGWWIRRHAGRIVDGRRFVRGSGNRSAETWQVESASTASVSPVLPVSMMPSAKSDLTANDSPRQSWRMNDMTEQHHA